MMRFEYKLDMPERRLLGRVSRVETIGDGRYGRTSYEIDMIDQAALDKTVFGDLVAQGNLTPFAIVRVVTTQRRFGEVFDLAPAVGDWLSLTTLPHKRGRKNCLPAWQAQLTEGGYTAQARGQVTSIDKVFSDGERTPRSLGARAASGTPASKARSISRFPIASVGTGAQLKAILAPLKKARRVRVRDVGQASFVTLTDGFSRPIAHFDAGWPLAFNGKTAPRRPPVAVGGVPVILSHWDWDHLHGYYVFPKLKSVRWIAPVQPLGPGAAKIAIELHSAGLLTALTSPIRCPLGLLEVCAGPASDCNQTGLALRANLVSGEAVLLVGDSDYQHAASLFRGVDMDGLVLTHHGGRFAGVVPRPRHPRKSLGVVSYGRGNTYKHPRADSLRSHRRAGWRLGQTAGRVGGCCQSNANKSPVRGSSGPSGTGFDAANLV